MAIIGENADVTMATAGNTTTGVSGALLATAGHAVTNTLAFRVEDVCTDFDNDPTVTNFRLLVSVNLAQDTPYVILGT